MTSEAIRIDLDGRRGSFRLAVGLCLPMGGISVLFGPSGSGKTTILRAVAGLERIAGTIRVGTETWQDHQRFVPTHRRALGYVFQEPSLFPHLSVRGNLDYAAKRAHGRTAAIGFDEVVALLGIAGLLDRSPERLSGGERQRVAIARALLAQPRLMLLDEPMSALDRPARDEILAALEALHAHLRIPILLVTHDLSEVERLADHVVLVEQGRQIAAGSIGQLQSDPALPLASRRDAAVTLEGRVAALDPDYGLATVEVDGGAFIVPMAQCETGARRRLVIAAGDVSLTRDRAGETTVLNILPGRILSAWQVGHEMSVVIGLGPQGAGSRILARVTRLSWERLRLREGDAVQAQVKSLALARPQAGSRDGP